MVRKPEIAAAIAQALNVNEERAHDLLSLILDEITLALSREERVVLIGFGTFENRERPARRALHPQTGAPMQLPARRRVVFKPGKQLKESVVQGDQPTA